MPFMFKVAILIEAIRSNCGGEWATGRRWLIYFVLIRLRYSRSIPRPFPSYSSAFFFNFIFLFRHGVCPGSSVLGFLSGGLVAPSAGTAFSLSSPSELRTLSPFPVRCLLLPACLHAGIAQSVWFSYRQMPSFLRPRLSLLGGSVQVVKSTGFASSSWGVRSCLRW